MKLSLKHKIKAKSLFLVLCAAALVVTILTVSYAWLYQNKLRTHNLETSNFILNADVFFLQDGGGQVSASTYKDASTGYYLVNISDPAAPNYAGKLNINVRYKGVTKAYLRVYIGDMWLVNGKAINKMNTAFLTTSSWMDNRIYDNFYYYTGGSGQVYCSSLTDERTIPFISGIDNMAPITGGQLYLEIKAEAVQINRINAFWGMSSIPQ